jgi:DNA-binding SARP family transcriptional activator
MCPAPLLVTVGRLDDTDVHVDLESLGITAVVGETDDLAGLVRAVTAEICNAPSSRRAHLVTVGATGDLVAGDTPHRAFTWDEVADDLVALSRQTSDAVQAANASTPFGARIERDTPDDTLVPTLVVVASVPDDPRFAELASVIAEGRSAVAVLVAGPAAPATVITVGDGQVDIPSLDLHATVQTLDAGTVDAIEDLLAAADEAPIDPPMLEFGDDAASPAEPEPDVVIRVLGRVRVDGAFRNLTPKQTAVVTFIALHAPVTAERIEDGVWPDATGSRRKRLANTLSECRNALGANALPVADGGLYRLGPGVTTDTALFDRHVHAARSHDPDSPEARDHLRRALELIEGPVFDVRSADRHSYVWVDVENWMATWELKIADVALALADAATTVGDSAQAVWAAGTGLRALPTHVELTEALMTAYAAGGDGDAAQRVYKSHVAALEDLDYDDVAESTRQLCARLRARETA